MRTLILGLGKSGLAAKRHCEKEQIPYHVVDKTLGDDRALSHLEGISRVVKSPGIPFTHPLLVEAQKRGLTICSEMDLALPLLKEKILIGITGSNGKTTTTLALKHVLGESAIAVGNIGTPLLDVVDSQASIFVIELSSFQLETLHIGAFFDVGIVLNITPNHLDYHQTFERYRAAKMRLKECIKPTGAFFLEKDFLFYKEKVESFFQARYEEGGDKVFSHDISNFAAVYAICRFLNVEERQFAKQIVSVEKPPHRLEKVGVFDDVLVINDSKSTSVDATIKAIEAIQGPAIVIVGGVDKGGDYGNWLPEFKKKVRHLFAFGEAKSRIQKALEEELSITVVETLEEAVKGANMLVKPNETILLSPGCSSYDQYPNYEKRGEHFKELIEKEMVQGRKYEPA